MLIRKHRGRKFFIHLVLIVWCVSVLLFLFWIGMSSFKTNRTVFRAIWKLPEKLSFLNYKTALVNYKFFRYILNSFILTMTSVAAVVIISLPAGYALTKMRLRFSNQFLYYFIAGLGIPIPIIVIPLYKMLRTVGFIDSIAGLAIVYMTVSIPFTVFLLSGFFRSIPTELKEAAHIDGSNEFNTFTKIMIPIATPGIVTATIFNFIFLWNEYFLALVFLAKAENRTLALALYDLEYAMIIRSDWVTVFAAVVMLIIPTVLIYVVLSERIISGITMGSLK